jgi:hypothetical protein
MRLGIVADHGGFALTVPLTAARKAAGDEVAGRRRPCVGYRK